MSIHDFECIQEFKKFNAIKWDTDKEGNLINLPLAKQLFNKITSSSYFSDREYAKGVVCSSCETYILFDEKVTKTEKDIKICSSCGKKYMPCYYNISLNPVEYNKERNCWEVFKGTSL